METIRKGSASTRVEEVYAQLRADVVEGRLQPGAKLMLTPLCQRFGVSLSVVREALTRLAEQKLARAMPQQGFMVTPLSRAHLLELTDARLEIERAVLRRALEHGDLAWEARVIAAHHLLANTPTGAPGTVSRAWMTAHRDFHAAVASGCPNSVLREIRQSLYDSAELYRYWSVHASLGTRDVASEHRCIADACLAHDVERAVRVMEDHMKKTSDVVLDGAANNGSA